MKRIFLYFLLVALSQQSQANFFEKLTGATTDLVEDVVSIPGKLINAEAKPEPIAPAKIKKDDLGKIISFLQSDPEWVSKEIKRLLSSNELTREQYDWIYDHLLLSNYLRGQLEIGSPARKNLIRHKVDQVRDQPPYLTEMMLHAWGYESLDKLKETELGIKPQKELEPSKNKLQVTVRNESQKTSSTTPIKIKALAPKEPQKASPVAPAKTKAPTALYESLKIEQLAADYFYTLTATLLIFILLSTYFYLRSKQLSKRIDAVQLDHSNEIHKHLKDATNLIQESRRSDFPDKDEMNWDDLIKEIKKTMEGNEEKISSLTSSNKSLQDTISHQHDKLESLSKYQQILDIENEIDSLNKLAETIKVSAEENAKTIEDAARLSAREMESKARLNYESAIARANQMTEAAEKRAEEIAGDAFEAKKNVDFYTSALESVKHEIDGLGSEFIIPNKSVLDDLAEEYDHKKSGQDLAQARKATKLLVRTNEAADCDYVEKNRRETAIRFVIDAYNGKVDSILSRLKHDNYGQLKQKIEDARHIVQLNGEAFRNARITDQYHNARLEELRLGVATAELKRIDIEEQREIKAQLREEERAAREYEKAQREVEKEERQLAKAMEKARAMLEQANLEEREEYQRQLADLESKLKEAEERGSRALSMAQQTRSGHVYIISNIGSFGDGVFKIGMTRRLEPLDRVRELGDASVPFLFDVHCMIYSKDAPKLEKALHEKFDTNRVNKVNNRKEFFRVSAAELRSVIDDLGIEAHFTLKAEAQEFRETQAIEATTSRVH